MNDLGKFKKYNQRSAFEICKVLRYIIGAVQMNNGQKSGVEQMHIELQKKEGKDNEWEAQLVRKKVRGQKQQ